ncbi:MAG: response regulator [Agarilytica sp.]
MLINKQELEHKLFKLCLAPTMLVCFVIALYFFLGFLEYKKNQSEIQIDLVAGLFENVSLQDKNSFDKLSLSILQQSSYFGIAILDDSLELIYSQGVLPQKNSIKNTLKERDQVTLDDKVYAKRKITLLAQNPQGKTHKQDGWILISKSRVVQSLWYYQAGSIFLLLIIYAFFSIIFFSKKLKDHISNELKDASVGIQKLIDEDYNYRSDNTKLRLFSPLTNRINALADAIQNTQEYLRNVVETSTKELSESLETVEIQNIEIDLARKNALKSNEMTCEFLANTSHEVRTPINGIIGFTNLLRKTAINDQQAEYIDTIEESAKVLLFNMNDMIDYSRMEVGKLNLDYKPIDVREIIIESHNYVLAHKGHDNITIDTKISQAVPHKLLGDSMRMQQAYNNLLSCAADFTEAQYLNTFIDVIEQDGGKFTLKISVSAAGEFQDNPAIREAHNILSSHTLDNKTLTSKNMMSLVIAKGLIGRMNGQTGISTQKEHTTFWLTLELGAAIPAQSNQHKKHKRSQFLVVDDNPANRKLVQELLKGLGVTVQCAESGLQALELCRQKIFDLILMDIQMPDMDGYDTAIAIRAQENPESRTPIVALTAHAVEDEKSKILLSGMDDFISKPIGERELCELITRWTNDDCTDGSKMDTNATPENEHFRSTPTSQPVSIITSLNLAKGKPDLAKDMLEMLLMSVRKELDPMKKDLSSNDLQSLQEKVHKIHGGACYCGVPRLLESSAKLDKALSDNDHDQADKILPIFFENCEELLAWQVGHDLDEIFTE